MTKLFNRLADESAQDSFEYLLAMALVAVPIAVALVAGFKLLVPPALALICSGVDTAGVGSCFG